MGPSKRPTCIMNVPKGSERIFEERMVKYSQHLMTDMNLQVQESQWTPSRINSEAHTKMYYNQTGKRQGDNPESSKGEATHDQNILNKFNRQISSEIRCQEIFNLLREKYCQQKILLSRKTDLQKVEIKALPYKQNLRQFITTRPVLQERLKGVLQAEMKGL